MDQQDSELDRAGYRWLAFCLFGGGLGLATFLMLKFATSQPDWMAVSIGLGVGLVSGIIFAASPLGRKLAAAIFDILSWF